MDYFKHICRICLEQHQIQTFDIFTSYYSKTNTLYSDMLIYCTKLKPSRDDSLPHLICKECSKQLKRTYAFNILCEESDRTLKDLLEKAQLQSKSEEIEIPIKNEDNSFLVCVDETLYSNNFDLKNEELLESLSDDIKLEPSYNVNDDGNWNHYNSSLLVEVENNKLNVSDENYTDHGEESCWDADDDNVILKDIKSKKKLKVNRTEEQEQTKPKKKRGRKKKVYLEGDLPAPPESKLPHQCDICGKFLSTRSNLKAHKICHTDQRPFKCADCPAAFKGYSALYQHRKVHTGETPYQCEYCNKRFRRRTGLVNHIRIHTGEKLYSCDICFKTFIQSAQLSIHMKRHKGDKAFLCQDCGKGFLIKADLRVHQRIHNGEKPYSCHLCTKTFATAGNLSIHVRIHKKEIRYHCGECQRGFVTKSAFNVHVKRHKNQRDYQCDCGKTFFTSSALKQHRVVHTGEKRYQCKICERKFSQNSHLNRHFKKDHGKPNAPLPAANEYKVIVQENKNIFGMFDIQKVAPNTNVKCEGS